MWLKFGTQNFMYYGLIGFEKNPSCAYNGNCLKKLSVVMNSFKKWLDFFFSFRSITYDVILII